MLINRIVIYAQDIMIFTGRSKSYAYNVLNRIRKSVGKGKHSLITFQEFADFHGIHVNELTDIIFRKH
ncbi:hypothetical protein PBT90_20080 [Algoriphagus halophytocola]|uniref:hypothetical protein n=1 Tax=Algoriphagus halophytocola TaxID=2991499 RepID=UPI0022DD0AF9|nr:hypothetical protein [Algoriphagus sp. TR-M9]WBL43027.1 hypothetical protein PBT90_20080 [Algoriphagus sp. TR-M9]